MGRMISIIFDEMVDLDDSENFEEVHSRIASVMDGLKDKRLAAEFIFGSGTADAFDSIVEQFPSLRPTQKKRFEWLVDHTLWDICTHMQDEYERKSDGLCTRRNTFNDRAMNEMMVEFRKRLKCATADMAIGLMGIEYPKINPADLKPGI